MKTGFVGKADPYVKISLYHNNKRIAKAKTDTQDNTQNPVFENSTHFFDLDQGADLKNMKIEFIVRDEDIGKDEEMGKIIIDTAANQWNQVINSPGVEFEEWHPLSKHGIIATKHHKHAVSYFIAIF